MPSVFGLSLITRGLALDVSGGQTSIVSNGLSPIFVPQPGHFDSSPAIINAQAATVSGSLTAQVGLTNSSLPQLSASVAIPIGNSSLTLSLTDLIQNPLSITGSQVFNPASSVAQSFTSNTATYTGSDLRIIVDLVDAVTSSVSNPQFKQLVECTTFTVSVHREKAAVRAAGYINPKGFARGRRTIAGTLVLTQFTVDVLYSFLKGQQLLAHDLSKDTQYVKVDQLPPFNMTLLFTDEYGSVSYRRILGIEFVTDGIVYSSNDMLAEQTVSYMASDFTPLLDIDSSALFAPDVTSAIFAPEKTVASVLAGNKASTAVPQTNIFSPPNNQQVIN